jgi:hypothetical protein
VVEDLSGYCLTQGENSGSSGTWLHKSPNLRLTGPGPIRGLPCFPGVTGLTATSLAFGMT